MRRLQYDVHSPFRESIARQSRSNTAAVNDRDRLFSRCKEATRTIFRLPVEELVWRRLAVEAGELPPTLQEPLLYAPDEEQCPLNEDFDALQPPWDVVLGELVVRGSAPRERYPYLQGEGPQTKYAALFDGCAAFDCLRFSFLRSLAYPQLEPLIALMHEEIEHLSATCPEILAALLSYCDAFARAFDVVPGISATPPGFDAQAWAVLTACMAEEAAGNFYLSIDELLLLCHASRQNCIIFGADGARAHYRGSALGYGDSAPVLVALHEDGARVRQSRVRSHFQRLILKADLECLQQREAEAAARREEEKKKAREEEAARRREEEERNAEDKKGSDAEMSVVSSESEAEKTSASPSEVGDDTMSELSDDYNVFNASIYEKRSWRTIEDDDLLIARTISEHLRPRPLLPPDRDESTGVLQEWEDGCRFPLQHCAFAGCT